MIKKIKTPLAIILSTLLILPPQVMADAVGRISYIEGRVDKLGPDGETYVPLVVGDEISLGDKIRTKSFSKAEIFFVDDSTVRLANNSQVQVKEYVLGENGLRETALIDLERGRLRATVSKTPNLAPFNIHTPNAQGLVKGSDLYVSYQKSNTGILVTEGTFQTINPAFPEQIVDIEEGTTSIVPYNAPPQEPRSYVPVERDNLEESVRTLSLQLDATGDAIIRATIVRMSGTAETMKKDSEIWLPASTWDKLNVGDKIRTGEEAFVELRLDNGHMIELHGKTQLLITELKTDVITGDHQSRFECAYGKIKAKVRKLEGDSKFEVTSPHAITGVRGTILYQIVLPNMTTGFFEGGNGYMTSIISNITKVVLSGMSASVYADGDFLDPEEVTERLREQFATGDDEIYGFSPAGGGFGPGAFTPPAGGPGLGAPGGLPGPFDDVPFTDPDGAVIGADFDAKFGEFGSFLEDAASSITGTLSSTSVQDPFTGVLETTLSGGFDNPNDKDLFFGTLTGAGTSGETVAGWLGGSWDDGWDGVLASIYVDPDGTSGTLFGALGGTHTAGLTGSLTGDGDIFILPQEVTAIDAADLEDSLTTTSDSGTLQIGFNDGGNFDGIFDRDMQSINDNDWGIWRGIFDAEYSNPGANTSWAGTEGGTFGTDGYYIGAAEGVDGSDGSLQIDRLGTTIDGEYLGVYLGTIFGIYGGEDEFEGYGAGTYNREALTFSGQWNEPAGDDAGDDIGTLYYNDDGSISAGGTDVGRIGGTSSPWSAEATIAVIGEYSNLGEGEGIDSYLWNTQVQSDNVVEEDSTTIDGGAFFGHTGGIWNDGSMDGSLNAIYIDPDGNAGILSGDVTGNYIPLFTGEGEEGVFSAESAVSTNQIVDAASLGIDPADLIDLISDGSLDGSIAGSFGGDDASGFIDGQTDAGNTYFINNGDRSELWGIFNTRLEGPDTFSNPGAETDFNMSFAGEGTFGFFTSGDDDSFSEADEGYFISDITGTWASDELQGELTGTYLTTTQTGALTGDVFGLYDEGGDDGDAAGTWVAESRGSYEGTALTFSGSWSPDSLYYNDGGFYTNGGEDFGLIGATSSPWDGPASVLVMGEYSNNGEANNPEIDAYIWNSPVQSFNDIDNSSTTLDGGAFWGYSGGIWDDNATDGNFASIYIDPDGNAGLLTGDLTGSYTAFSIGEGDESGFFQHQGTISAEEKDIAADVGIDPENLSGSIDNGNLESNVIGAFPGSENGFIDGNLFNSETYFIDGDDDGALDWGLYNIRIEAEETFSNPDEATTFEIFMGGNDEFGGAIPQGGDDLDTTTYWLASATGSWEDGIVDGELDGNFISNTHLGTLSGGFEGTYSEPEGDDEDDAGFGQWIGQSVGTFESVENAFAGIWNHDHGDDHGDDHSAHPSGIYRNNEGEWSRSGTDNALIGATTTPWSGSPADVLVIGRYESGNPENGYLWNTAIISDNQLAGNMTTSDGGSYWGYTGGLWTDEGLEGALAAIYFNPDGDAGILRGDLDGAKYALDPNGGEVGVFSVSGDITATELDETTGANLMNVRKGDLDANVIGSFDGDDAEGWIEGSEVDHLSATYYVVPGDDDAESLDWGVFDLKIRSENGFANPNELSDGALIFGGSETQFGGQPQDDADDYVEDRGYWVATSNTTWTDGEIRGDLAGQFLTPRRLGTLEGDIFGLYETFDEDDSGDDGDPTGNFILESVGSYQGTDLTFNGEWNGEGGDDDDDAFGFSTPRGLYGNNSGEFYREDHEEGLIGATSSPWNTTADLLAMGEFEVDTDDYNSFLWNSPVFSYNPDNRGDYRTFDEGAFFGLTGGLWLDEGLDGAIAALYIDPDGNAGIIRGGLSGNKYVFEEDDDEESGIWTVSGTVTGTQLDESEDVNVDPEDFPYAVYKGEVNAELLGSFGGDDASGFISGEEDHRSATYYIVPGDDDSESLDWGIFDIKIDSEDVDGNAYSNPNNETSADLLFGGFDTQFGGDSSDDYVEDNGFWVAAGDTTWQDGQITGNLTGNFLTPRRLGTLEGDIFGLYDTEGEDDADDADDSGVAGHFILESIGSYQGEDLTFNGQWNGEGGDDDDDAFGFSTPRGLYGNNSGEFYREGNEEGLIGATSSPWNTTADILAMGEFEVDTDDYNSFLWNSPVFSYNPDNRGDYRTFDGGSFFGLTGGLWLDEGLDGAIAALYIDPDGNAGIIRGGLSGNKYVFDVDDDEESGIWTVSGTVTGTQLDESENVNVDPEDFPYAVYKGELDADVIGFFGGDDASGVIAGEEDYRSATYHIVPGDDDSESLDWGIFDLKIESEDVSGPGFANPNTETEYQIALGGNGQFGGDDREDDYEFDEGVWLATASGTWQDNQITGTLDGQFLTGRRMGTLEGDVFGLYELDEIDEGDDSSPSDEGSFILESVGSYQGAPLTFSGEWNPDAADDIDSLYYNADGVYALAGEEFGLIGATSSPWDKDDDGNFVPANILAMGYFYHWENGVDALLWNSKIYSYFGPEDADTTADGGSFAGFTGGLWTDENLDGTLVAVYADPDGNAGLLLGGLSGNQYTFYEGRGGEEGMWMAEGEVEAMELFNAAAFGDDADDAGIGPEYFDSLLYYGEINDEFVGDDIIFGDDDSILGSFGAPTEFDEGDDSGNFIEGNIESGRTVYLDLTEGGILPWGAYEQRFNGPEYLNSDEDTTFFMFQGGAGQFVGEDDSGDDSPPDTEFLNVMAGTWGGGTLQGGSRGIFISDAGFEGDDSGDDSGDDAFFDVGIVGIMRGDVQGIHYTSEHDHTWIGQNIGYYQAVGFIEDPFLVGEDLIGLGSGAFDDGGAIDILDIEGFNLGLVDEDFALGIFTVSLDGTYGGPFGNDWNGAFGTVGSEGDGSVILGTLQGSDWSNNFLSGDMGGFLFGPGSEPDTVFVGAVDGVFSGTYEDIVGEELDSTFEAAAVGDWIELAELETSVLGFDMEALTDFVEVPITEIYSDLLTGTGAFGGAGGSLAGVMDINFFANIDDLLSGIWGSDISGTFSGDTSNDWSATFTSDGASATFTGAEWADGQWVADVAGSTTTGLDFSGQAGGTFNGDGTFAGGGAGTWADTTTP